MTLLRPLAALALLVVGCGGGDAGGMTGTGGNGMCATKAQCNADSECMAEICVSRSPALRDMALDLRLTPESSPEAAFTEFPHEDLDGDVNLTMQAVEAVQLDFAGNTNAPLPVPAGVIYTLPSCIPGRPPLTFATELPAASTSTLLPMPGNLSSPFDCMMPELPIVAELRLLPRPGPDPNTPGPDQDIPPYVFPSPPGHTKKFEIPNDLYAIRGSLRDAAGRAPGAYIARAFHNGVLVSNRPPLLPEGDFVLYIPASAAGGEVSIELVPTDNEPPRPWYKFAPFVPERRTMTRTVELGTATLAAYTTPAEGPLGNVVIKVAGDETGAPNVAGALVRATLTLQATPLGATRFQQDAVTNAQGTVTLRLLPGTSQAARDYDLQIFPAAGDTYANKCTKYSLTVPGGVTPVTLAKRLVQGGKVRSPSDKSVVAATVIATRLPSGATDCVSPVQLSTSTVTDSDGTFTLNLEAGKYRIDFIPQSGSGVPRFTKPDVNVPEEPFMLVALPKGALVQGQVVNSFNQPVADALIRIFAPACPSIDGCTTPPALLAETQTDAVGHFRVAAAVPE